MAQGKEKYIYTMSLLEWPFYRSEFFYLAKPDEGGIVDPIPTELGTAKEEKMREKRLI
jgi:hypothetical protein